MRQTAQALPKIKRKRKHHPKCEIISISLRLQRVCLTSNFKRFKIRQKSQILQQNAIMYWNMQSARVKNRIFFWTMPKEQLHVT